MTDPALTAKEPLNREAAWALLERLAASAQLRRAARLQELLFYVGRQTVQAGRDQIKEQEIGSEVFGRQVNYDTSLDNIVRTNVSDLRKRMEAYFSGEGSCEPVIVEIPRGSYIPVFRARPVAPDRETAPAVADEAPSLNVGKTASGKSAQPSQRHWMRITIFASIFAILLLSAACITLWLQVRTMQRSLYPWRSSPAVADLWSGFLDDPRETDLVLSDSSYSLVQDLDKKSFALKDYISRDYLNQLRDPDPKMAAALNRISEWGLGSPGEFDVAERLTAMDPLGKKIHLYFVRKYPSDLFKRDNVILMGSRYGNPWAELIESRMNFTFAPDNPFQIVNHAPRAGEQHAYTWNPGSAGYCIVAYLPNPDSSGRVLLIEGSSSEAVQAAGDFLLSQNRMASFETRLGVTRLPYFEFLLKTSWVKGTALDSTIEAYRAYPKIN